jgi:hypothetical protein
VPCSCCCYLKEEKWQLIPLKRLRGVLQYDVLKVQTALLHL